MCYFSAFCGGYESASPLQHLQPASGHDITPQSLLGVTSTQQVENVIELDEGIVIIVCAVLALTLPFFVLFPSPEWPDPLFAQYLLIDNYKHLAARGSGTIRIPKLS